MHSIAGQLKMATHLRYPVSVVGYPQMEMTWIVEVFPQMLQGCCHVSLMILGLAFITVTMAAYPISTAFILAVCVGGVMIVTAVLSWPGSLVRSKAHFFILDLCTLDRTIYK